MPPSLSAVPTGELKFQNEICVICEICGLYFCLRVLCVSVVKNLGFILRVLYRRGTQALPTQEELSTARKKGRPNRACSQQVSRNLDVAVGRFGVRADAVRRREQLTSDLRVDTWYGSVETCPQEKAVVAEIEVDLGVDRRSAGELDLSSRSGELDRTDEAGRPGGGKQPLCGRMRLREPDIETSVAATCGAIRAARGMSLTSKKDFFGHSLVGLFS